MMQNTKSGCAVDDKEVNMDGNCTIFLSFFNHF